MLLTRLKYGFDLKIAGGHVRESITIKRGLSIIVGVPSVSAPSCPLDTKSTYIGQSRFGYMNFPHHINHCSRPVEGQGGEEVLEKQVIKQVVFDDSFLQYKCNLTTEAINNTRS